MACGVPVIGVGTGDKYPIRHRETGFLLPPDSQAISNQIRELSERPEFMRAVGVQARAVIVKEFSNQAVLPRLRDVYRALGE
jgi:glycosyltransferase involved in cell wall biosynthesis